MEITEVRIKIMEDPGERLQGFCSITFDDCFVVRDLKIIEGGSGPFVAMPSRKLTAHCPQCGCKNHLRAAHCNQCGGRLKDDRATKDEEGRAKLYADIAHPINAACREMIQERVIAAYRVELERSKMPGYVSTYDDPDEEATAPRRNHERRDGGRHGAPRPVSREPVAAEPKPAPPAAVCPSNSPAAAAAPIAPPVSEGEPRAPHKPPAHHNTGRPSTGPKRGSFGAGIL